MSEPPVFTSAALPSMYRHVWSFSVLGTQLRTSRMVESTATVQAGSNLVKNCMVTLYTVKNIVLSISHVFDRFS